MPLGGLLGLHLGLPQSRKKQNQLKSLKNITQRILGLLISLSDSTLPFKYRFEAFALPYGSPTMSPRTSIYM